MKRVPNRSIERSKVKNVLEEYPFYCHRGGLSEDGWRTMLECLADSVSRGEGRFVRQHTDHAACLGAEMIGSAGLEIMRNAVESRTIGPSAMWLGLLSPAV